MKLLSYVIDLGLFFLMMAMDVPWIIAAIVSALVGAAIRALFCRD